MLATLII